MKVAMIGHKDFPSRSGGVEVMVGGLATSLVRRGYEVTVYNRGLQKGHNVYTTEGVQARRIFTFQKASLNAMVYSFLATFDALTRDCDVIHYHAIGPSVPLVIAKLFGKHTVCTVHGLNWKVDKWGGTCTAPAFCGRTACSSARASCTRTKSSRRGCCCRRSGWC